MTILRTFEGGTLYGDWLHEYLGEGKASEIIRGACADFLDWMYGDCPPYIDLFVAWGEGSRLPAGTPPWTFAICDQVSGNAIWQFTLAEIVESLVSGLDGNFSDDDSKVRGDFAKELRELANIIEAPIALVVTEVGR